MRENEKKLTLGGANLSSTATAKKRVVALCVADDPVMTKNMINNLVQAAGQTLSVLERQTGDYGQYESEECLWQEFIEQMSDDWVAARHKLDAAKARLDIFDTPEHKPLGSIGAALDAPFVDAAEEAYEEALKHFNAIDNKLRKCDTTLQKYEKISAEFNSSQQKKKYIKEIRNALGIIEGSMHLSQMTFNQTLSLQLPATDDQYTPSDEDLDVLAGSLKKLIANIPQKTETVTLKKRTFFHRFLSAWR